MASIKAKAFRPLKDNVFVTDLDHGAKVTPNGLIIPDDDMTNRGIRPRWGRVYAVGPDVPENELKVGQWIMTEHGRWTNKITIEFEDAGSVDLWRIEHPKSTLMVTDDDPRKITGDMSTPGLEFALKGSGW